MQVRLIVPYSRGDLVARAHAEGEVQQAEHMADGTLLQARVLPGLAVQLEAAGLAGPRPCRNRRVIVVTFGGLFRRD